MLHCRELNVLLCADQVLAKITPNISVEAMDPDGDPLGIYLRSLDQLKAHDAAGRSRVARAQLCRSSACRADRRTRGASRGALPGDRRGLRAAPQSVFELVRSCLDAHRGSSSDVVRVR